VSWFGGTAKPTSVRREVDTGSQEWEICLHEMGQAIVARELGWTNHEIRVRRTWLGDWDAGYCGDPPRRVDGDELALQLAAVALGGPEVSRRRSWLFLPSGCDWDLNRAKSVLRGTGVRYSAAQGLARRLVARRWDVIEGEARRLYLAGGRWTA
jgi:hypothetical protein